MSGAAWFLLIGGLLLAMGLTAPLIRRLPVTSAMVYLGVGVIAGPMGLGAVHFNPLKAHDLLAAITEVAVLLSLFTAGMKMPVPVRLTRWRAPILLATVAMAVTAVLMTAFGVWALGLSVGAAVLLAGILVPTDPVLATEVQVRRPGDRDRLRFGLTSEAGLNDGTAFPVVALGLALLGLNELGAFGARWALIDVLWFSVSGIGLGIAAGVGVAHLAWSRRRYRRENYLLDDFIGLGLIGMVYGLCLAIQGGGFLAVFAAAVALRQTELRLTGAAPDETGLQDEPDDPPASSPSRHRVSDGSLVFKEQLERLAELALVMLIGGTLFFDSWSWRAVATALFLFLVARPIGTGLALLGSRAPRNMRYMVGWFGVRGIGSLFYLVFAIDAGVSEDLALELIHITLVVVTLSIVLHGVSVKPLLLHFWHRRRDSADHRSAITQETLIEEGRGSDPADR